MGFVAFDSQGRIKEVGSTGATGSNGTNGATGAVGPIGPAIFMSAEDGSDGEIGPQGPSGVSGSSYTPTLTIAQAAQPGTLNVSTEGTIDWLVPNGTTTTPRIISQAGYHTKAAGGPLGLGFDWIIEAGTVFTQNDTLALTSTLSDETATSILSSSISSQGISIVAGTGPGWRLTIPSATSRTSTLKIYCSCFSAVVTVTANLPFEALTQNLTFDSGAAAGLLRMITITFKGSGWLNVNAQITTNRGSTPNVKFQAATLF